MRQPQDRLALALLLLLGAFLTTVGGREALAEPTKPVLVVNDPVTSPVPVRDTENPAHSAFQERFHLIPIEAGMTSRSEPFTVLRILRCGARLEHL